MATLKPVQVLIDFETTYGEDPGTTKPYIIPMTSAALSASQAMENVDTISSGRDVSRASFGLIDVNGDLNIPVSYENFPVLLKMIIGDVTSGALGTRADTTDYLPGQTVDFVTGTGSYICITGGTSGSSEPTGGSADGDQITDGTVVWVYTTSTLYEHVLAAAPDCVGSFLCEIKFLESCGSGSSDVYMKYNGLKTGTGSFAVTTTGVLAFTISTMGASQTDNQSGASYTPYPLTNQVVLPTNRLFQQNASVTIEQDKYSLAKSTTLNFNNNLTKEDLLGGVSQVTEGQFNVSGNLESIFDGTMFAAAKNHVKTSMDVSFAAQFGGILQQFDEVDFSYMTPSATANESSPLSLEFQAFRDTGTSAYKAYVYNSISSY